MVFKILVGMLHRPVLLFRLRLFISFSISFSCMGFKKNEFITFCFKYLLNGHFAFRIFDARTFEPILTKKLLKVSTIDFLFVIVILFNVNEFDEVLAFSFKAAIDLISSKFSLMFVEYL